MRVMPGFSTHGTDNGCRPCASRDPSMSPLNVLCLSPVQQTLWNTVYRDDSRPGEARLGAQGESHPWFHRQVRRRSVDMVRAARLAGSSICQRAADQEMETGVENPAHRSGPSVME